MKNEKIKAQEEFLELISMFSIGEIFNTHDFQKNGNRKSVINYYLKNLVSQGYLKIKPKGGNKPSEYTVLKEVSRNTDLKKQNNKNKIYEQDGINMHEYISSTKLLILSIRESLVKLEEKVNNLVEYNQYLENAHIKLGESFKDLNDWTGRTLRRLPEIDDFKINIPSNL